MDAGRVIGAVLAGSSLLSGLLIGAGKIYEKSLGRSAPKSAIELPKMRLPPGNPDE